MKIIWIDGTFGVGKTAVANAIAKRIGKGYLLEFDSLQMKYSPNSVNDFLDQDILKQKDI